MTEKPFIHEYAYADMESNFIYHEDFIKLLLKVLNVKGVLNIGGPTKTIYNFARTHNPLIKKKYLKKEKNNLPLKASMSLRKLNKILKKNT